MVLNTSSLSGLGGTLLNIGIMLIVIVVLAGITYGVTFLFLRYKQYNEFRCVILHRDGFGQLVEKSDTAGIFVDKKTNNKRFFMKKNNVGLNPDNVPYLPGTGGKKTVYLSQVGLKNFRFIHFNLNNPNEFGVSVGEEDVNWAINAYERQKKMFSQSMLMQLMPFMIIAFVSIIILVIFIYFFKNFGVLKSVAQELHHAAEAIAQAKSGTTIIN